MEHASCPCNSQYWGLLPWKIPVLRRTALPLYKAGWRSLGPMPLVGNAQLMTEGNWLINASAPLFLKRSTLFPRVLTLDYAPVAHRLSTYNLSASFPSVSCFLTSVSWDHSSTKCIQIILILGSASMKAQRELDVLFDLVIYSCVFFKKIHRLEDIIKSNFIYSLVLPPI